jgi:hypothetical protein
VSVKSILHEIAHELNRPHWHDEIEETDEETIRRKTPAVSQENTNADEIAALKEMVAKLSGAQNVTPAAPVAPVAPVGEVTDETEKEAE